MFLSWRKVILPVFAGFCLTVPCAADGIRVFGAELRGLFEADGTGPYHEAFTLLTESFDGNIEMMMAPQRRAENQFGQGNSDCLFAGTSVPGYYEKYGLADDQVLVSDAIFSFKMKVYGRKDTPVIENWSYLRDKTIAIDIGVGNVDFVADIMEQPRDLVLPTQSLIQAFQLLNVGRVSALVAVDLDVRYLQAREPGFLGYPVSSEVSVMESEDVIVCRHSTRTEALIEHVNRSARSLHAAHTLEALLNRYLAAVPQP